MAQKCRKFLNSFPLSCSSRSFITFRISSIRFLKNLLFIKRIAYSRVLRDGSLSTCGEGKEDILIYLMEFSSPSQIYVDILIPTPGFQTKLHSPSLEMLFILHPPPSECAEFWYPLPDVFHPPLEELMTDPLLKGGTFINFSGFFPPLDLIKTPRLLLLMS